MRLHRFYIQNANFETLSPGKSFVCQEEGTVKQIALVLRGKAGDRVRFFNDTREWELEIESISKKDIVLKAIRLAEMRAQSRRVILIQSLVKKDKFEWIVQKATELGVTEIIPVISERSEKRGLDHKRLEKIAIEATEQSGWGRVPSIQITRHLREVLENIKKDGVKIYVLDMQGKTLQKNKEGDVAFLVGPEGGWGSTDRDVFNEFELETISLSVSTLRAETAAIIASHEFAR